MARRSTVATSANVTDEALRWRDIDFDRGFVKLKGKAKVIEVPLHDRLRQGLIERYRYLDAIGKTAGHE